MKKLPSRGTIIRTGLLVLALINNTLALTGKSPLPIADEELTEVISYIFTVGTALVTWWKNNSFTAAAIEADEMFKKEEE